MDFIDLHCDTLGVLGAARAKGQSVDLAHLPQAMVDFERMRKGGQMAQFFAVFMPPAEVFSRMGYEAMDDETYIATLRKLLLESVEAHSDQIAMAYNGDDLMKNKTAGKMSAVLTMEDGRAVNGNLDNLQRFYDMGFRAIALTWNFDNCLGHPNSPDPAKMALGLTTFGKEAVEAMQSLGILVDVSHLSEGGFYDVAAICKKPFVATHSNSRALCPHPRGLTDKQVRTLAESGGVTGLNFCPAFLTQDVNCPDSTAAMIARQARHLADVGGVDCVALGSDFDGIGGNLEVGSSDKVSLLIPALEREGFSDDAIEKIFWKNALRVIRDAMH